MGSDDGWALQMMLKAEKNLKNIKILAITAVNGNTTVENVIKNTYRLLDGLGRTDVKQFEKKSSKIFGFFSRIHVVVFAMILDSNLSRCYRRSNSR